MNEKMTAEKAIGQLNSLMNDRENHVHCDDFDDMFLQDIEACKAGIQALEKQVLKKLVRFNENFYTFYTCPDCMKYFNGMVKPRYCSGCGQALDWGDDHE